MSFRGIGEDDIAEISLPSVRGEAEEEGESPSTVTRGMYGMTDIGLAIDALSALTIEEGPKDVFVTPPQLDGDLVTLTLLPRTRWQTLLNLEVIQQRNKPKEPPKPPEKAPFFLPTLPGVETRFAPTEKQAQETKKPTRRLDKAAGNAESVFHKTLMEEDRNGDCE